MALIPLLGLIVLCAGLYGVFKGRIGGWVMPRGQFGWMSGSGFVVLVGGAIADGFGNPLVGGLAFLAWTGMWAGVYGLIRGQIGPIRGRGKAAIVAGVSVLAIFVALGIQALADNAVAAKKAADLAAAQEAKYQQALEHVNAKRWEPAIADLTGLGGYKDAPAVMQETKYLEAASLVAGEQWDKAVQRLSDLGAYKDTEALLKEAQYRRAEAAVAAKKWPEAKELLAQVPASYKQVDALYITVNNGLTAQYYSEAMQAKEKKSYVEAERLLTSAKLAGGKAPANLDAELKTVVNLRVKAEEEAAKKAAEEKAKAERIAAEAGPKPENSSWDAAVAPVVAYLKRNLKDPDSVQYIEWSPVTLMEWEGKYAWGVRLKYRAKNSFGGYIIEEKIFFVRHEQVADVANY